MEQDYDQEQTGVATEPTAIVPVSTDYWLPFRVPTGLMPDRQFDRRPAGLHVHRVYPPDISDPKKSAATHAVVLIHGRTVPGPVVFDLEGFNNVLSVQQALAKEGIDTFAPSLLGYGRSTRFDEGLNDPGNASLGACPDVGCDRTLNEAINPYDQQGTMLLANPLGGQRRRHSSTYRFARTDVWVRDIDQVIYEAVSKLKESTSPLAPMTPKVALVGYSAGGQHVGRTLYAANQNEQLLYADDAIEPDKFDIKFHNRKEVIDKVSRVVFLNSLFFAGGPTEDPANPFPTFPLTLNGKTTPFIGSDALWTPVNPDPPGTLYPGRVIPGTQQQVWDQTMEHETVGRAWGTPWSPPPATVGREGGLNRAPTFSGYGWNSAVAGQLSKSTLVMQGLEDGTLPTGPGTGQAIYNALNAAENKVLVKVECSSHAMVWEGCNQSAEPNCTPPYETLQKALIGWIKNGTFFDGATSNTTGKFTVKKNGEVIKEQP
jgi:pimeloyl-ACP methyl ester carboxylesterase